MIGVARFSNPELPAWLQQHGVEPLTADLLDPRQLAQLPEAANVIVMTALKFGSQRPAGRYVGRELLDAGQRLPAVRRQPHCRIFDRQRLSADARRAGRLASKPIRCRPSANTPQAASAANGCTTISAARPGTRLSIVRLNYACELRYGVLVDLARQILAGEPIDLAMGAVNVIWQGDANAMTLQSLGHAASPPFVVNVAGPETLSVRRICEQLGELLGKPPVFTGSEGPDALLTNGQLGHRLFGYPRVADPAVARLDRRLAEARRRIAGQADEVPGARREVLAVQVAAASSRR